MKKLILPILFGVFSLFFSGKSIPHKNCGPFLRIANNWISGNPNNITVTKVVIQNYTQGTSYTYDNPVFPLNHNEQGGSINVTCYFDDAYGGCLRMYNPCQATSFYYQGYVTMTFTAFNCDYYYFYLDPEGSGTCSCQ